jgi:hypothetical protein
VNQEENALKRAQTKDDIIKGDAIKEKKIEDEKKNIEK